MLYIYWLPLWVDGHGV